jgi:8-hydroxy-5-deazaflavin:NADPH oxidoreductase
MRVGVLGSGMVGEAIGARLLEIGHEVRMGSRTADGPALQWARTVGDGASAGDFQDAASFGEVIVNATAGGVSLAALRQAGSANLDGKVLIDIANPLSSEHGPPVTLTVANTDSLAEQIQREYPSALVVKTLNTMNCSVMVHPEAVPGDHVVFLSSNDPQAKRVTSELLSAFGWPAENIVDLGGIETARGTEAFLLLWLPLWQTVGTGRFNIAIHRGTEG